MILDSGPEKISPIESIKTLFRTIFTLDSKKSRRSAYNEAMSRSSLSSYEKADLRESFLMGESTVSSVKVAKMSIQDFEVLKVIGIFYKTKSNDFIRREWRIWCCSFG